MKLFKILLLILIFSTPNIFAQSDLGFDEFDSDNDWWIERNEFIDNFTKIYSSDWDSTNDNELDDEDFYLSSFKLVDKDNDDNLDEEEWRFGYKNFFGDYISDDFAMHDYDDNNFITYEEYFDSLYDSDYFMNWDVDKDKTLSQYELAEAVFNNWDRNNNGLLGRGEFNSLDEYFLDL